MKLAARKFCAAMILGVQVLLMAEKMRNKRILPVFVDFPKIFWYNKKL